MVRVVVATVPRMSRELVIAILERDASIDVIENGPRLQELRRLLARTAADVLIVNADALTPGERDSLLYDRCRLKMLVLGADQQTASLVALVPEETPLGELNADALLDVVRSAATEA